MLFEFLTIGTGTAVLVAGTCARLVAARGRSELLDDLEAPRMAAVTQEALDALPLVAPDRAGYGTASRLLLQSAARHRPATVSNDHRQAA
jgi:ATP-dependent helicase YprA (DUF1998 family)